MLYDKLKKYTASGVYPMHMPDHKQGLCRMSIFEVGVTRQSEVSAMIRQFTIKIY